MIILARRRCHRRPDLAAEYDNFWSPGMRELFGENHDVSYQVMKHPHRREQTVDLIERVHACKFL